MQIVKDWPPNIEKVATKFDLRGKNPIFCWGDIIYFPGFPGSDTPTLPEHLIVHEKEHSKQQEEAGGPELWWAQYLDDDGFRLSQEVTAYRAQYEFIKAHESRQVRRNMLKFMATDLSGAMYGKLVSFEKAKYLIEHAQSNARPAEKNHQL